MLLVLVSRELAFSIFYLSISVSWLPFMLATMPEYVCAFCDPLDTLCLGKLSRSFSLYKR